MTKAEHYEVIVIGGSYAGLAAAMALGRSLRKTLVIDAGQPCNRQTPASHNFITHDGRPPAEISQLAREQVGKYQTVKFENDLVTSAGKIGNGFEIGTQSGKAYQAKRLLFASGIKDLLPRIPGLAECWGISVIHCPYCHGYEVRDQPTGILANGEMAAEFARFVLNWTRDLSLFTNGEPAFDKDQEKKLMALGIKLNETPVKAVVHHKGHLQHLELADGTKANIKALYAPCPFEQSTPLPAQLGCETGSDGYLLVDPMYKTTVPGVYAAGDCITRVRTVANAVAGGTTAAMMLNKELVLEKY